MVSERGDSTVQSMYIDHQLISPLKKYITFCIPCWCWYLDQEEWGSRGSDRTSKFKNVGVNVLRN